MASDGHKTAPHAQASEKESSQSTPGRLYLGFSSIMAIVFLSTAAIALAYIGGVMSGRHLYVSSRPEVAKTEENVKPADKKRDEKILSAEELEFAKVLRGENRPRQPATVESPEKKTGVPTLAPALPETAQAQANTEEAPLPQQGAPENTSLSLPINDTVPEGISDYVLQMAAFRDEAGADKLRQKLEGFGLRTLLERDGKLCIVLVRIRGNEERIAELANIASQLKLGTPLVRSRKPVPR